MRMLRLLPNKMPHATQAEGVPGGVQNVVSCCFFFGTRSPCSVAFCFHRCTGVRVCVCVWLCTRRRIVLPPCAANVYAGLLCWEHHTAGLRKAGLHCLLPFPTHAHTHAHAHTFFHHHYSHVHHPFVPSAYHRAPCTRRIMISRDLH